MGTTHEQLLLDNIATTLAGITVGNGYASTVALVEPELKAWEQVPPEVRPWIGFAPSEGDAGHEPFGQMRCTLEVDLLAYVLGDTAAVRRERIMNLFDDTIAALQVDTGRGDNAVRTNISKFAFDDLGDQQVDSFGGGAMFVMTIVVHYDRRITRTT